MKISIVDNIRNLNDVKVTEVLRSLGYKILLAEVRVLLKHGIIGSGGLASEEEVKRWFEANVAESVIYINVEAAKDILGLSAAVAGTVLKTAWLFGGMPNSPGPCGKGREAKYHLDDVKAVKVPSRRCKGCK